MNNKGLSLSEALVAALLLSLTVGSMLYVFTIEGGSVEENGRRTEAMNLAAQTLEQLRYRVGEDSWPGGDLAAGAHNSEAFLSLAGTNLGNAFSGARAYTVQDVGADYKRVTVSITWIEP